MSVFFWIYTTIFILIYIAIIINAVRNPIYDVIETIVIGGVLLTISYTGIATMLMSFHLM